MILGISVYYLFFIFFSSVIKTKIFYFWTFLLFCHLLGAIFSIDYNNSQHFSLLKGTAFTLLVFYPIYYYSRKIGLNINLLIKFAFFLLPLFIAHYFLNYKAILESRISGRTDIVNNVAYYLVAFIPFLFLLKRINLLHLIIFIIVQALIFYSAKRGAIIVGFIEFVGMCIFIFSRNELNIFKKFLSFFIISGLVFVVTKYYIDFSENSVSRFLSLFEGNYSGRDTIYGSLLNTWYESGSLFVFLFGFGFGSSLQNSGTGNLAHNDWIELLFSFGLSGLFLYSLLIFSIIKILHKVFVDGEHSILSIVLFLVIFVNSLNYRFIYAFEGFLYILLLLFFEQSTIPSFKVKVR